MKANTACSAHSLSRCCLAAKVDLHRRFGVVIGLEELEFTSLETTHAGDDAAWKHLHAVEEVADIGVVEATRARDASLGLAEFLLQLQEVLIGFEIWIGFERGDEASGSLSQLILDLGSLGRPLVLVGDGLVAQVGDFFEHTFLVLCVALDRLDQVGDEIMASLEFRVDVRP